MILIPEVKTKSTNSEIRLREMSGKRLLEYSMCTLLTVLWSEHAEIPN